MQGAAIDAPALSLQWKEFLAAKLAKTVQSLQILVWAAFKGYVASDHEEDAATLKNIIAHEDEFDYDLYEDLSDPFIELFVAQNDLDGNDVEDCHQDAEGDIDLFAEHGNDCRECDEMNNQTKWLKQFDSQVECVMGNAKCSKAQSGMQTKMPSAVQSKHPQVASSPNRIYHTRMQLEDEIDLIKDWESGLYAQVGGSSSSSSTSKNSEFPVGAKSVPGYKM